MDTQNLVPLPIGETDLSPWLEGLVDRSLEDGKTGVRLAEGVYGLSRTLELPTGLSLEMDAGARLLALPGFTGDAVLRKARTAPGDHAYNGRISGGVIDGGSQSLTGIHVPGAARLDIHDLEIMNCLHKGICIGDSAPTWGYEVNVRGVRCSIDLGTRHSPESIGLHYIGITDSFVSQVVIIGYETGVASESSSNDYSQVHVWSVPEQGRLPQCFYCNGWGDSYQQCYADSPFDGYEECFGFYVNRPFNRFNNCRTYCNSFSPDLKVTGFYLADSGTHGSYFGNFFAATAGHRMKAAYAGNFDGATILGSGYEPTIAGGREDRFPAAMGSA